MTTPPEPAVSSRLTVSLIAMTVGVLLLGGCQSPSPEADAPVLTSSESAPAPASSEEPPAAEEPVSALIELEGRAVSASDTELVLRTAAGEQTFQIRNEDLRAIDPDHIRSHLGIASIGFRVFSRNIDGVDYVVSIEEIDGSTLGFD